MDLGANVAVSRDESNPQIAMNAHWRQLEDLFAQAIELSPEEWPAFIAEKCGGAPILRQELESLLQANEEAEASFHARGAAVRDIIGALSSTLLTGQKLGSYRMGPILGEGGMGIVYQAVDACGNPPVAVKVIPQELARNSLWRRRFSREVRAMAVIQHPNVVRILDYGEDAGCLFLAMELIQGETLRDTLERGPLPLREVLDYSIQIAAALEAAHGMGVIHQDLKPGNIMVAPNGLVKVVDFGLSRLVDDSGGYSSSTQPSQVGTPAGTIDYLSPEQAGGRAIDTRSDLFAMGSVLYEMLTGKRPFHRSTNLETAAAILRDRPEPLAQSVPVPVARLVDRCLVKEVEKRSVSASGLQRELEELREKLERGKLKPQRFRGARRAALWAVPLAVLLALLAVGLGARREGARNPFRFQKLTDDPHVTNEPALSMDGRWLAYASDRAEDGNVDIWIQPTSQGAARRLTNDPAVDHQPALSPDGQQIAFRSERDPAGIYTMSVNRGAEHLLVAGGRNPQFSPDGKWIAYWSGADIKGDAEAAIHTAVLVIPSNGGEPRRLAGEFQDASHPVWSPDSRQLLFAGHRIADTTTTEFWTAPLDGGTPRLKALWRDQPRNTTGPPQPIAWPGNNEVLLRWFRVGVNPSTNQLWLLRFPARPESEAPEPKQLTTRPGSYSSGTMDRTGRLVVASGPTRSSIWSVAVRPETGEARGAMSPLALEGERQFLTSLTADGRFLLFRAMDARGVERYVLQNLESARQTVLGEGDLSMILTRNGRWISVNRTPADGISRTFPMPPEVEIRSIPTLLITWDLSREGTLSLSAGIALPRPVELKALNAGEPVTLLQHPSFSLYLANFSPDDRWILVTAENGVDPPHLFAVPFVRPYPVPVSRWIDLGEGSFGRWAPSGRRIYFLRDHHGSRCLYTLALDPASKQPAGEAVVVLHLHSAWRSPMQLDPGFFRLLVGPDKLIFSLGETQSNLWLAER
jgi:serine/threonine protein kinase